MSARFGDVTVYEASERFAGEVRTTASLNGVADRVTVNHAIVGQAGEVWDEAGDAQMVDPGTLPDCDVLVLDCEGGETEVLPAIECTPHTIIVECGTAPHASIAEVRPLIEQQEYDIVSEREQGEQTVIEARSGSSRNGRDCALDLPVSETNGSSSRTE